MAVFQLTNKAIEDLGQIWNYTLHKWSEKKADQYYRLLIESCQDLASNPDMGKSYFEVYPNMKGHHVNRHIIFYSSISSDKIHIVRILHERMDLKNRITE